MKKRLAPARTSTSRGATAGRRVRVGRPAIARFISGGMIALGGPPLGGKSLLAARLAECLPRSIRMESIDDLSRSAPYWQPAGPRGRSVANPTSTMLAHAVRLWRDRRAGEAPVILLVARFATAAERRRARAVARESGMRFLFVEALSRDERALRRIPMSFLSPDDLQERLRRFETALQGYQPVSVAESVVLPALRLTRVQSRFDEQVDRVLDRWHSV